MNPSDRRALSFALIATLLLFNGCAATAPEPPPTLLDGYLPDGTHLQWKRGGAVGGPPDAWWQAFGDPALDALQGQLQAGNLDVPVLVARVDAARATLLGADAAARPQVSASLGATRSDNVATPHRIANGFSLGASASWEIDLWGRLAAERRVARANLEAAQEDVDAARWSVQYGLTQLYLEVRAAETQQATLERNVCSSEQIFFLTRSRFEAGMVSRADLLQAEAQMHAVQTQGIESGLARTRLLHAIAVLIGRPPGAVSFGETARLPLVPDLPADLSSAVLERRPDVHAAERRVAAAWAQMGVADAAYFPVLALSGSAGYRGASWRDLLDLPNRFWSFGPSLAAALLDGGARASGRRQARAAADGAVAVYRQTVLTGLQEITDNLESSRRLREAIDLQAMVHDGTQQALDITLAQYRSGTAGFLNVLVAQQAVLGSEATLTDLRRRELLACAQLLKNAGGRW